MQQNSQAQNIAIFPMQAKELKIILHEDAAADLKCSQ